MMCSRPGLLPEVLLDDRIHALVVPEHHALKDVAHRRAHARRQVRAGGQAQPVDRALQTPATTRHDEVGELRLEQDVLAAPPKVPAVVELAGLRLRQRLHAHGR